jgi:hypothetical protein
MAAPQRKVETDQPIPICEVRAKYTGKNHQGGKLQVYDENTWKL